MAEHTSSLNVEADINSGANLMDQRAINARLDRLESSLEGIWHAINSLTRIVDRLFHAVIRVSGSGSDAQMPSRSRSFCHPQQERLTKDQEENEHEKNEEVHVIQKNKEEADLYTFVKVARDEDFARQVGRDIYFDLVDHDKVKCFHVKKQMHFIHFKDEVAKEFGIPVHFMRFWLWAKRQSHCYRPNRPVTYLEETQSVGQLREVSNKVHNAELKLFLEVELGPDLRPIAPPEKTKGDILLFFKLYDHEKEELRYVGRLFVKGSSNPSEILTKLNEMAGYHPKEEIALFEEIKFDPYVMCDPIDKKLTFRTSLLEDGDIICFQKAPSIDSNKHVRYPDGPSYLEYVLNRQVVHFRSLDKPKEDDFCVQMSRLYTYDDVVERVAQQLGLEDPSKLRLTPRNCDSQQPNPQPIKYCGVDHLLSDMLGHYNQTSDILYYEVLDIPLPELQGLKTLKVAFHHATKDEVAIHTIRLPKQSTVGDVLDHLKTKVEVSHPNAELRLLELFHHKIDKVFTPLEKIENINDQNRTFRAEEIPEEERNLGPHDAEILVPLKLHVPDEEFAKWKFAFVSLDRPKYFQDSDIVSSQFQRRDVYNDRHTFEKPLKI
ncbi:hypothetical protein K1719_035791 [Acacia pycnantha]|nr:hypothetical protein K1719_035791 [Acacia pycnantha]